MYSVDFRKRVVKRFKEGEKKSHLAKLFRIGRSTLERWCNAESLVPQKAGPKKPWKLNLEHLQDHVQKDPGAYHDERAKDLKVSPATISYGLKRLGISRKKNDALPRAK
jgi:transposase